MSGNREIDILQECRLEAAECGAILSRNNSGRFQDKNGRWVAFGVFSPGGSDLIGWKSVIITPEMVGQRIAIFTASEIKKPGGRVRPDQQHFVDTVKAAGGIAGIITSREEMGELLS